MVGEETKSLSAHGIPRRSSWSGKTRWPSGPRVAIGTRRARRSLCPCVSLPSLLPPLSSVSCLSRGTRHPSHSRRTWSSHFTIAPGSSRTANLSSVARGTRFPTISRRSPLSRVSFLSSWASGTRSAIAT